MSTSYAALTPELRAELLKVLDASDQDLTHVIQAFGERGKDDLAETLADVKADDALRLRLVAETPDLGGLGVLLAPASGLSGKEV